MQIRVRRLIVVGVATPLLTLSGSAVAMADTAYQRGTVNIGPSGIAANLERAAAHDTGDSSYGQTGVELGRQGLTSSRTHSYAGRGPGILR